MSRYDVIVIGGGVSGLGVAVEASTWGFDTLLLERERCARATSANSLRIIHGGLRYLQRLDVRRLLRSAGAQSELSALYGDIVKPLECVMPLERVGTRSRIPLGMAAALYSGCARWRTGRGMEWGMLDRARAEASVPFLAGIVPHGAFYWTDAFMNDPEALVSAVRKGCEERGAEIEENSLVVGMVRSAREMVVKAKTPSGEREFRGRLVVNAAGPWVDSVRALCPQLDPRPARRWAIGFNVELDTLLEESKAVGLRSPAGRLFFLVPRGRRSVLGTGYVAVDGPDSPLSERSVAAFLDAFSLLHRGPALDLSNVTRVEKGALPMASTGRDGEPELVGSEEIHVEERYVEILSTKYTTFLPQGREALRLGSRFLESA